MIDSIFETIRFLNGFHYLDSQHFVCMGQFFEVHCRRFRHWPQVSFLSWTVVCYQFLRWIRMSLCILNCLANHYIRS